MTLEQAQERIAELEEQVKFYQWELGLYLDEARIALLKDYWRIPPLHAKVLLLLYNRDGKPLSGEQFLTLLYPNPDDAPERAYVLSVLVHQLRKRMGPDAIRNIYGTGYVLDPSARRIVAHALGELSK